MSYEKVSLGSCCEVVSGATPKTGIPEYWDGDVLWATPKDLGDLEGKFIRDTPRKITQAGLQSCAASILPIGSVLLSSRAPIGHVAINAQPMATNQGFKSLVPKPGKIDAGYLYHWLRGNRSFLQSLGNGATFKEVSKSVVEQIRIPLPPMEEQQRIAQALDQVNALRDQRRQAVTILDALIQSIFLDMFGDVVSNDRNWPVGTVAKLVREFQSGKSFAATEEDPETVKYRILKVSAVTTGKFMPEESKAVPASYIPPESHFVREGDLLFSRANTEALIGAVALVSETPNNLILPDKIWRFVWHAGNVANRYYVRQLFRQEKFRREIGRRATGTSGSMKNISQEKVLGIPCALVPTDLQNRYGERVAAVEKLKAEHLRHLAALDSLFASIQYRAFRGELWADASAA
ncbi:restriction endonuclease subunit S [Streptomyces sp. GESEQ-13]|uniref:restriction endonuclease subunit S n=1 Tax=Streptomyces sp. GESEQ-13 TaxID=2812654 RepID=UPI001B324BE4